MGTNLSSNSTPSISPNSDAVHIAFGVDTNYFRGMAVNITSILKNNPGMVFIFHVFAFSITDDSRRRLEDLEKKYDIAIHIYILHQDILSDFNQFPCFSQHPLGTFIRILIPNLLQGITNKALYLDADILCLGELRELQSINIDDCIAAVVHDEVETTAKTQIAALKLSHADYFNAGVMYINIDNWVANDCQSKALTVLSTQQLLFADQDALNAVLNGHVKYIDEKWNFRYHLVDFLSKGGKTLNVTAPVVFMHFTGPVKPWHDWCLHEAKDIFIRYQSESSWADVPLDRPKSARELKLFSKFLAKQGRVAEGIYWHAKYLWKRSSKNMKPHSK